MNKKRKTSKGRENPYTELLKNKITIGVNKKNTDYLKNVLGMDNLPRQFLVELKMVDDAEEEMMDFMCCPGECKKGGRIRK